MRDESGHIGAGLATLLGIAAAVALSIGTLADSDVASVAGAVAVGLGIIVAVSAPHEWVKRIYPRLDKLDPNDPEAQPEKRFRVEL